VPARVIGPLNEGFKATAEQVRQLAEQKVRRAPACQQQHMPANKPKLTPTHPARAIPRFPQEAYTCDCGRDHGSDEEHAPGPAPAPSAETDRAAIPAVMRVASEASAVLSVAVLTGSLPFPRLRPSLSRQLFPFER
jgi:hypothetical protein